MGKTIRHDYNGNPVREKRSKAFRRRKKTRVGNSLRFGADCFDGSIGYALMRDRKRLVEEDEIDMDDVGNNEHPKVNQ